jgi:hypothetical protein
VAADGEQCSLCNSTGAWPQKEFDHDEAEEESCIDCGFGLPFQLRI